MILSKFRTAMLAAIPGLDAPDGAFFRVARQIVNRLNLQPVNAVADQMRDLSNVEVCPGIPGVTSDPTEGEEVIVLLVGKDKVPRVIARASEQMAGHTPIEVRHDAKTAIRLISKTASSGAKVYVGTTTFPLARAADLIELASRLTTLGTTLEASGVPEVVAVGAAITLEMTGYTVTPTTKLESA